VREEEPQSCSVGGHLVEVDGVTLRKEFVKVHVEVVQKISIKLISLHEGDVGRAKVKVVGLTIGLTIEEVMPDAYSRA